MTLIRTSIFAAAVALGASVAQAETRSFPATGFDRVGSSGPWDVSIATGKAASVRAEGATEDLDRMRIEVRDGALEIGSKKRMWSGWKNMGKVRVWVTMPSLRAVGVAGSGDVTVDKANAKAFKASVAGSGRGAPDAVTARPRRSSRRGPPCASGTDQSLRASSIQRQAHAVVRGADGYAARQTRSRLRHEATAPQCRRRSRGGASD